VTVEEANCLDDTNMRTILHGGNHGGRLSLQLQELCRKRKILGWTAAARRSKENETKISFQSCGKRTSQLEITTEENQTEIQAILYGKGHTLHGVEGNW
jgi:hypothetical protein